MKIFHLNLPENVLVQCNLGGGVLLGILGKSVPPDSPNPDPISDP